MLDFLDSPNNPRQTGNLGGSMLNNIPVSKVLTFLSALKWRKVNSARPWGPDVTVATNVVEAPQVKIDAPTSIDSSNYPEALTSTLLSVGVDPLKFGRMGISYSVNYDQHDATVGGAGANSADHWRYVAALASLWEKLDEVVIEGSTGNSNQFNGLKALAGSNVFSSSGTTASAIHFDIAKMIANVASLGQGGTALVGNDLAQRLLTAAFDGGRTEYGPGPMGGLIPFFDKVPFLRASVSNEDDVTDIYCVNLSSLYMFHTSGTRNTFGFSHRATDKTGTVPLSAASEHIVYGGHALNVTNDNAVWYGSGFDVSLL